MQLGACKPVLNKRLICISLACQESTRQRQTGSKAGRKVGKQAGVWGARKTPRGGSSISWSQPGWQMELEYLRLPAPAQASRHAGVIGADRSKSTGSWEDAEDLSVSSTCVRLMCSHLVRKHSQVSWDANRLWDGSIQILMNCTSYPEVKHWKIGGFGGIPNFNIVVITLKQI